MYQKKKKKILRRAVEVTLYRRQEKTCSYHQRITVEKHYEKFNLTLKNSDVIYRTRSVLDTRLNHKLYCKIT